MPSNRTIPIRLLLAVMVSVTLFPLAGCGGKSSSAKTDSKPEAEAKTPETPEAEVQAALADMVATFEKQDFRRFFELYMPVDVLREVRQGPGLDSVVDDAKRATPGKQAQMAEFLAPMKAALKSKPILTAENTVATFIVVVTPETTQGDGDNLVLPIRNANPAIDGYGPDLTVAVAKAVTDLEAGKPEAYLAKMLPVSELKLNDLRELAQQFAAAPGAVKQTIADLKSLIEMKPKLEDDGSTAVFEIVAPKKTKKQATKDEPRFGRGESDREYPVPPRVFKFQKVGGHWRLYDNTTPLQNASKGLKRTISAETKTVVLEKIGNQWRLAPEGNDFGGKSKSKRSYSEAKSYSSDRSYGEKTYDRRFEERKTEAEKTDDSPRFPGKKTEAKTEAAKTEAAKTKAAKTESKTMGR